MKRWLYPLTCLLLSLSLAACGTNNAARPQNQAGAPANDNTTGIRSFGYATSQKPAAQPGQGRNMNNQNGNPTATFDHNLAKQIAQAADNVPGVEGATAVVRSNEVVVGINTRVTNTTATQQTVIERQVHSAVRAIAPNHRIRVTSDATMVTRIRTLASNTAGYGKEMTNGPNTTGANLANAGQDFMALVRDLGRTATAPFR